MTTAPLLATATLATVLYWPYRGGDVRPRGLGGVAAAAVGAVAAFVAAAGIPEWPRAAYAALLATLALTDARHGILPWRVSWPGGAAGLIFAAGAGTLASHAAAALLTGGVFLVAGMLRPDGVGGGDVWMAALLGAFLGSGGVTALALGCSLGAVCGIGWAVVRRRPWRRTLVRLGPFLAVGGVAATWFPPGG